MPLAAGRSIQEAIDYFGEWHGLGVAFFTAQYAAHGLTPVDASTVPTVPEPETVALIVVAGLALAWGVWRRRVAWRARV